MDLKRHKNGGIRQYSPSFRGDKRGEQVLSIAEGNPLGGANLIIKSPDFDWGFYVSSLLQPLFMLLKHAKLLRMG